MVGGASVSSSDRSVNPMTDGDRRFLPPTDLGDQRSRRPLFTVSDLGPRQFQQASALFKCNGTLHGIGPMPRKKERHWYPYQCPRTNDPITIKCLLFIERIIPFRAPRPRSSAGEHGNKIKFHCHSVSNGTSSSYSGSPITQICFDYGTHKYNRRSKHRTAA